MKKLNNAFKTVKIKASSFADGESLQKLEDLYMFFEAKKTDAVEAIRKATVAAADATIKQAERVQAEVRMIAEAASFSNVIAREARWMVFKDPNTGELTFEGVTEKLMRNNFRAQQSQIGKSLGEEDYGQMFEDSEEED